MSDPFRLCFVVESGTDVRMVDELSARCALTVVARAIPGGVPISQRPEREADIRIGPAGRIAFAAFAARQVGSGAWDHVLLQGYGIASLAAGRRARASGTPTTSLVCSPVESYYRARRVNPAGGKRYHVAGHAAIALLARLSARQVGRYVVLSNYLASVVLRHGTAAPIHVIPVYGVDVRRFCPSAEPGAALRRRLRLPESGTLLFLSSRVAPEKDTPTVLRALGILRDAGRDVRLLHRSGGYHELLRLATALGVADRVIAGDALHPQRELADWYRAADLCIQASLDEGLGFSPLEALACGTPVVASGVGGLRETVEDGRTGWTVAPRDTTALARAIGEALDDPVEAARRAAAGRTMVVERFEQRMVFEHFMQVLRSAR